MNRYRLLHVTTFDYDGPVTESYNEVRLRPMQDDTQSCLSFRLSTEPASKPSVHHDFFGNWVYQFNVLVPTVAASDTVPLVFTLGGVRGKQNLVIAIQ